jgi:hypothetical protein
MQKVHQQGVANSGQPPFPTQAVKVRKLEVFETAGIDA